MVTIGGLHAGGSPTLGGSADAVDEEAHSSHSWPGTASEWTFIPHHIKAPTVNHGPQPSSSPQRDACAWKSTPMHIFRKIWILFFSL